MTTTGFRHIDTDIEIGGYYFVSPDGQQTFYRGCTRCGGTGHYSFNGYDSICYKCGNHFDSRLGDFVGTREEAEADAAKRAKARAARERARENKRLKLVAKQDAKVAAARAEFPEVVDYLLSIDPNETRNAFLADMVANIQFVSSHDKPFTANMAAAVKKMMDRDAAKKAESEANPVQTGRIQITGEIVGTKVYYGDYGTVYKVTVKDDRGFKVYGSLAKALVETFEDEFMQAHLNSEGHYDFGTYGPECWFRGVDGVEDDHGVKGRRITFTATVEASDDDPGFGFFSRPTKAQLA